MTNPAPKTSFAANEPVVVSAFVAWLFSVLGAEIIGHTDLVTSADWGTLSTILVPVVSGVVLAAIAWVTRRFVTPAWKVVTGWLNFAHLPPEVVQKTAYDALVQEIKSLAASHPELAHMLQEILAHEAT